MDIADMLKNSEIKTVWNPYKEKHVDFKIFGNINKTFTIDFKSIKAKPKKATKVYTAKELDLPWKEVPKVFIGGCGATDKFHFQGDYFAESFIYLGKAHTHMCPYDKLRGCICISHEFWIKQKDGQPSDLMWHEYGHVLTPWNAKIIHDSKSKTFHRVDDPDEDLINDPTGHGQRWQHKMIELGKPHINKHETTLDFGKFDIPEDFMVQSI